MTIIHFFEKIAVVSPKAKLYRLSFLVPLTLPVAERLHQIKVPDLCPRWGYESVLSL